MLQGSARLLPHTVLLRQLQRRLPQVSQMLHVARKIQTTLDFRRLTLIVQIGLLQRQNSVRNSHSVARTDLLLAGPLFRKKCGGPYYMNTPLPDCLHPTRTVVIIDILLWTRAAMHTTIAAARHTKSLALFPNHYFNISGLLPCCKK